MLRYTARQSVSNHLTTDTFGRLKDWRRIATRYDRCAHTCFSAICIAATAIFWLGEWVLNLARGPGEMARSRHWGEVERAVVKESDMAKTCQPVLVPQVPRPEPRQKNLKLGVRVIL
jgi:hypothetical protein